MPKKVSFATTDEHKFWLTDKPVSESNNFVNQPLGYCLKCNTVKYLTLNGNRCMNCFVPKPALKKANSSKNTLLFSKSAESLSNSRSFSRERASGRSDLRPNKKKYDITEHTSSFIHSKPHEFEEINENLSNRYPDSTDLSTNIDKLYEKHRQNGTPIGKPFVWKCEKCNQALHAGEIAISAEHADPLARWHPKCFACAECNTLLNDLLYYNHDNKIFCKKHYHNLTKPKVFCAACDMVIDTNEYVKAEDHFWHKEHFVCWDCETTLAGKKYIVFESKPHCLECHTKNFSKKCNSCNWTIPPDSIRLTYENIDWHASPNCFKCFACHKNLLESQFLLKNSLLFCSLDCKRKISVI